MVLDYPPRPQSLQLWVNGLRMTEVQPKLAEDGRTLLVDDLTDGDLVTILYVPGAA